MLGIVTVDDVLDIAEQRATEDIQKLGGSEALGASYLAEIARAVVLALFVPLIISSGGNSGSQATSLIIRALALRAAAGLVAGVRPRNRRRPGPGRVSGSHRLLPDRAVAAPALRRLRPPLPAGGAHGVRGPDRSRWLRHTHRQYAAVHSAQARLRPRDRIGAVCRHAGRCHRSVHLLRSGALDSARDVIVAVRGLLVL